MSRLLGRLPWIRTEAAGAVLLMALALPASSAQTKRMAGLRMTMRDSRTGYAVPARVIATSALDGMVSVLGTDLAGLGQYHVPEGRHKFEVSAPGYRPMRTDLTLNPDEEVLNVRVWLDPEREPAELRRDTVQAQHRPGMLFVHGHVVDAATGLPVRNAAVSLASGASDRTDGRGYFSLYAPVPDGDPYATDELTVLMPDCKPYRRSDIVLQPGDTHLIVNLEWGDGTTEASVPHKLLLPHDPNTQSVEPAEEHDEALAELQADAVSVPASIRVGFGCTCASCPTVQVFSLDTYVANGVDDEWFSSWTPDSLKAGAVAYRSYGAYHVVHPRATNYDICSTTCCQVNDPTDTATSVQNAVVATAGVLVVNAAQTEPLFSEYAAENNGGSCADAQVGQPSSSWPCMGDSVCAGQAFNGHGRGLCQWGSQRWSLNQGKDWRWIVNHYYNDNGNATGAGTGKRTGILQEAGPDFSLSSTPSSRTVAPGGSAPYTVTVTGTGGFNGSVTFAASGLPAGASAGFSPSAVTGTGSTAMTVTTATSTPSGSSTLTVIGTSGGLVRTTSVALVVQRPDFTIAIAPSSRNVKAGSSASYTVTIGATGGFTGVVALSASGLPAGATASFSPASVTTSGSSTLTVRTTRGVTPRGTATFTVTGTSGALAHGASASLQVK